MKAWRNAKVRDFNIGIQSSDTPNSLEVPLAANTVAAIGALDALIVFIVYAPINARPVTEIAVNDRAINIGASVQRIDGEDEPPEHVDDERDVNEARPGRDVHEQPTTCPASSPCVKVAATSSPAVSW